MAISSTIIAVDPHLDQGVAEWTRTGLDLLTDIKEFCEGHTHTGTLDGLTIPAGGYAALSIDDADLASNAVTTAKITDANVTVAKLSAGANLRTETYVYGAEADTFDYPVFRAPAACVINAIRLVPAANIVSATDNGNILRIEKYSAAGATLGGTLCTIANTVAASTLVALVPATFGAITGGTLTPGQILAFTKSTIGSGLAIGVGALLQIEWTPS